MWLNDQVHIIQEHVAVVIYHALEQNHQVIDFYFLLVNLEESDGIRSVSITPNKIWFYFLANLNIIQFRTSPWKWSFCVNSFFYRSAMKIQKKLACKPLSFVEVYKNHACEWLHDYLFSYFRFIFVIYVDYLYLFAVTMTGCSWLVAYQYYNSRVFICCNYYWLSHACRSSISSKGSHYLWLLKLPQVLQWGYGRNWVIIFFVINNNPIMVYMMSE